MTTTPEKIPANSQFDYIKKVGKSLWLYRNGLVTAIMSPDAYDDLMKKQSKPK